MSGREHARGPSRKGLLGNSCVENKGFMVQETAKNLVSGRVSRVSSWSGSDSFWIGIVSELEIKWVGNYLKSLKNFLMTLFV